MEFSGKPVTLSDADAIVKAIRSDKTIGVGTCSVVDECYTDSELLDHVCFDWDGTERKRTPKQAVSEMKKVHKLHLEREREHRNNW